MTTPMAMPMRCLENLASAMESEADQMTMAPYATSRIAGMSCGM